MCFFLWSLEFSNLIIHVFLISNLFPISLIKACVISDTFFTFFCYFCFIFNIFDLL